MGNRLQYRLNMRDGNEWRKDRSSGCKTIQGSFGKGQVYIGHSPLGWCVAESPARPLYIISLREPISRLVSYYDYVACRPLKKNLAATREGQHLRDAEKKMEQQGIPSTEFLEHLFLANDTLVMDMVTRPPRSQMPWLLPGTCSSLLDDPRSRLSIALTNLLRCDIVVDSDRLSDQLLPQLWYHAPQTRYLESVKHSNGRKRLKQVLSNATVAKMLEARRSMNSIDGIDADIILYDFAKRVARAREDRARACWGAKVAGGLGRNGINCSALCAINVTATELELIRSPSPSKRCSSDLPTTP